MAMELDRLRAFVWTLDEGSISAAARRLHRSQPAVTRLVQHLEGELGGPLLDRGARPLGPTALGQAVLPEARSLLRAADELARTAEFGRRRPRVVRIGVSRSLSSRLASPELRALFDQRDLDLRIRSGWSPRLCQAVKSGDLDGAVVLMPLDWRPGGGCRTQRLRRERLVVVGASARRGATDDGRWILNPDGCGFRRALAEAIRRNGRELDVAVEVDASPAEHIALAAAGMGLTIVPASSLAEHRRAVREVRLDGLRLVTGVWMVSAAVSPHGDETLAALARVVGGAVRRETGRPGRG